MKLRSVVGLGLALIWGGCVQILDADYEYKPQCTTEAECDDGNPCTSDSCSAELAACEHTVLSDLAVCSIGMANGLCAAGVCTVECSDTKPCDDMNPCTTDSCDASNGTCAFSQIDGMPTPGFQEPAGDCYVHVCQMGVDTAVVDDMDVPVDMNSCTDDICTNGVPSNPPVSMGTPCVVGQPAVCDGLGACVECNVAADCVNLPPDDECQQRACINNTCGQSFTPMGTPISMQTVGDCRQVVCNGAGATMVENLDADVPEDNNLCTQNVCTNGVPSNPNEAQGFSCGNPLVCDGNGQCVGCNTTSDCAMLPMDDFCKKRTCINSVCGLSLTPAGTDLPTGQTGMDCKVLECDAMGNVVTSVDVNDKPVDGNQCTQDVCSMLGVPSNPPVAANTACSQNGGTVCNGMSACTKTDGAACAASAECLSGFCVDGVCCEAACGNSCKACNVPGSVGKCVNVSKGNEDGPACTGTNSCDGAGTCKKDDGQACAAATDCVSNFCVDGVCCSSACTTACRACNVMGSVGICTPLTSGEDNVPANVCNGPKSCDASGACKSDNGQSCTTGSECVSGQCFDGVCCNVACSGTCKSCNITGAVGTCSNVASGQDDTNGVPVCSGATQSCDGMGVCKKETGQVCTAATECLSGFCADGYCCNSACTTACKSCGISGNVGVCSNVNIGQDDPGTCSGTNSCDGVGSCKKENGQLCAASAECLSSFCVDGYCCNTACGGGDTTDCQACSASSGAATNGTCGLRTMGTVCRAAMSFCDVAEVCSGVSTICPTNAYAPAGTVCAPQSCTNSTQTNADTCDGAGTCIDNGTTSCGAYVCSVAACLTTCTTTADCSAGFTCVGNMCQ